MGYRARVSADVDPSIEPDLAPLAQAAPVGNSAPDAPLSGYVWRNGRAVPFTLETTAMAPNYRNALPERMIIGVLLVVSFVAPIFHLLG